MTIELRSIEKSFGVQKVLQGVSLKIEPGLCYAIIGASGCGKTTCLRIMNGLIRPDQGEVLIGGQTFDDSQAVTTRRQMGYSLQGRSLFPHMNVLDNLSVIARRSGWSKTRIKTRAEEVLNMVNMNPSEYFKKKPSQLSGGQQQRVGIARAVFMSPKIMLMDEPFGALDPITRHEVQDVFMSLQEKLGLTVVLVTHDLSEAFKMAHQLVVLDQGRVAQVGRPSQLLRKPASDYVREFLKTNSPGHILETIQLFTVMRTDVWLSFQTSQGFKLIDNESGQTRQLSTLKELTDFHQQVGQQALIWVREFDNCLDKTTHINLEDHRQRLKETDPILSGLKMLLDTGYPLIPVVDPQGKVRGVFDREAIDVLA